MDRLTSIDASFLAQEREGSHMHIGGILIFEGPPPGREELNGHVSSRLHLVPRYRQKLAFPRFEMGRPLWIEDPRFNIDYHVRHTAVPAPGTLEQLRLLAARIFSQPPTSRDRSSRSTFWAASSSSSSLCLSSPRRRRSRSRS
jgi:diacylglycerol O-acyltransferase / wax synthase